MATLTRLVVFALSAGLVFSQTSWAQAPAASVPLWPPASIEIHPALAEKANRMAVILIVGNPGATVEWLNRAGFCVFVLMRPEGSSGDALADTHRAIRMVRLRAEQWKIGRHGIGVMGFESGEPAARAALDFDSGERNSFDATDQISDRPDFAVLDSDGWKAVASAKASRDVPPTFLAEDGDGQPADSWHTRFVDWITDLARRTCCGTLVEAFMECLCH